MTIASMDSDRFISACRYPPARGNPNWYTEFLALTRLLAEHMDAVYGWADAEIKSEYAPVTPASVAALDPQPLAWVNIYGRAYVEQIGHDRLMSAPAWRVEALANGGVMATLGSKYWPIRWEENRAFADHLGIPWLHPVLRQGNPFLP